MRGVAIALLTPLLAPLPAAGQAVLWEDGPARLVLRDGRVTAERDGGARPVAARGPDLAVGSAEAAGVAQLERGRLVLLRVVTAEGPRLVGWLLDARGWQPVAGLPIGEGEISADPLAAPDPAFPAPAPRIPLRLLAGRLVADAQALAAPVSQALGAARCPGAGAPPTIEEAARRLAALPPAEAEALGLRMAACLVLAARPFEARRVLGAALGRVGAPRLPVLEGELAAWIACSPNVTAIRRANPPEKTFLIAACANLGPIS